MPDNVGAGDLVRWTDGEGYDTVYIKKKINSTTAVIHSIHGGTSGSFAFAINHSYNKFAGLGKRSQRQSCQ
ncbi:MAG: hypothetical protein GF401_18930 [Chitinivibrionales bacterium]|nr:hypothetical protein [Chitinivibrionales bacterium]